ncbi:camphor resistance protein CrcB [Geobacillus subterraneus]|uniref:Fluoride-specific ion channel FluC n=2 Tax=Geobacillus TaxID=129337 RepID=A0ABM6A8Z8_9BACL|nr:MULTISPECIES: fluoride efflux transporter CrcB [Geobacillus]AMX82671.1 camphor resistance protein CrcB [Geobacillus subterraneus]KZS26247.1 camphor resistance protein CrcB [Geobacillus subterraneus]OXB90763.1 camphor resistance protein CrcB [Geobacillus uzenensis]
MMASLLVMIGGFFGAICRYAVSRWAARRSPRFPLGTLIVNLLGSFLLGWLAGSGAADAEKLLVGTGFMGAFTTFSTFKWESVQMMQRKQQGKTRTYLVVVCSYLVVTYSFGVLLAWLGYHLGR